MKVGQAFPSDYLLPEDIGNRDVPVVIEEVALKQVGRDNQYVIYFEGKRKGLIIYKKQARQIVAALGEDEMDNWPGKTITLYVGKSDMGKDYIFIREQAPVDASRHQAPRDTPRFDRQPPPTQQPIEDDGVPF